MILSLDIMIVSKKVDYFVRNMNVLFTQTFFQSQLNLAGVRPTADLEADACE